MRAYLVRIQTEHVTSKYAVIDSEARMAYRERVYAAVLIAERFDLYGDSAEISFRYDPSKDALSTDRCFWTKIEMEGSASLERLAELGYKWTERV